VPWSELVINLAAVGDLKGQVTIPAEVRARLGLRPGSRLAFVPTKDGFEIHPQAASIADLKGAVPRPAEPVSIEEMNEAIAGAATGDAE
jgi:AbrB family looped-hinge helix DNA binding protein